MDLCGLLNWIESLTKMMLLVTFRIMFWLTAHWLALDLFASIVLVGSWNRSVSNISCVMSSEVYLENSFAHIFDLELFFEVKFWVLRCLRNEKRAFIGLLEPKYAYLHYFYRSHPIWAFYPFCWHPCHNP